MNKCTHSAPYLITIIHQDEEEVKTAHDGGGQVDVLLQTLATVITSTNRVGGSQDGCASVQCGLKETESGYSAAEIEREASRVIRTLCGILKAGSTLSCLSKA